MSDIAPIHSMSVDRLDTVGGAAERSASRAPARQQASQGRTSDRPSDRVDISDRARYLNKLSSLPDIRQDLVDRVRQQIAQGTYETPDKLDQAISGLVDDLEGHS